MAKTYKVRPSQILNIKNDYDAFCFDEACDYILSELSKEKPRTPKWEDKRHINTHSNQDTIKWMMKHNKSL
jgi:translation initiation factor 2B subunit (eIF-2B alpha/beta/delta family)